MKRLILLLSILFSAVAVKAQSTDQTPEQRAHIQAEHLQKLCATTDEQTQKAEVIFLAKIKEINAILTDNTKSSDQKKIDVDKVKAEKDAQLKLILTPDQYTIYRNKMDEVAARRNGQH
jgi:hypothetical protein